MQNARKMQDGCSQKCELKCRNPNKIKGLENVLVTEPTVFQDRLVMTTSIILRAIIKLLFWKIIKTVGFQDSCPSENIVEMRAK